MQIYRCKQGFICNNQYYFCIQNMPLDAMNYLYSGGACVNDKQIDYLQKTRCAKIKRLNYLRACDALLVFYVCNVKLKADIEMVNNLRDSIDGCYDFKNTGLNNEAKKKLLSNVLQFINKLNGEYQLYLQQINDCKSIDEVQMIKIEFTKYTSN